MTLSPNADYAHTIVMVSFGDPSDPSGQRAKPMCLEHGPDCPTLAPNGRSAGEVVTPNADYADTQIRLYRVTLPVCNLCLQGIGQQCHVPGCAFWMSHPPDLCDWMVERMELLPDAF